MPVHFNKIPKNSCPSLWNREELYRLHVLERLGEYEIAKILKIGHSSVGRALKRLDIPHPKEYAKCGCCKPSTSRQYYDRGYIYVWDAEHKRYRGQHRLAVETSLGRVLRKDEIISSYKWQARR